MPEKPTGNGRLDSWKEIASYLGRDQRTVMRWEDKGLPVHRVPGGKRQAVFGYPHEIDEWMRGTGNGSGATAGEIQASSPGIPETGSAADSLPWESSHPWRGKTNPLKLAVVASVVLLGAVSAATWLPQSESSVQITGFTQITHNGTIKTALATDGANLYFSEAEEGKIQLATTPVTGGPIRRIQTPFPEALVQEVSRDSKELLVLGREGKELEKALWIVPLADGAPRRVGQIFSHSAAWSPDGSAIAWANGNGIYLSLDGGVTSKQLLSFESEPSGLHWSRFTRHLLFHLRDPQSKDMIPWEVEFGDAFKVRSVSRSPSSAEECCNGITDAFGFSFFSSDPGEKNHLWAVSQHRVWWQRTPQVTELPVHLDSMTTIAADPHAKRLFVLGCGSLQSELVMFKPFSQSFSPLLPGVSAMYADFSPDGNWITYTGLRDGALWVSRSNGQGKKQLTFPPILVELSRWSPDGTQIAFMAQTPGKPWRIFVISPQGGPAHEVSSGTDNQGAPTWSPDGKSLVYADVGCESNNSCAVHQIELSTSTVRTLPGSSGLRTARWSPDGRFIAALQAERHQLFLYDVASQKWRKLADSIMGDDLNWSRDSRYLFSNRGFGERPEIIRIPIFGGATESVLDLRAVSQLSGRSDIGFGLGPDGSIILARQISPSEIYALDWAVH